MRAKNRRKKKRKGEKEKERKGELKRDERKKKGGEKERERRNTQRSASHAMRDLWLILVSCSAIIERSAKSIGHVYVYM